MDLTIHIFIFRNKIIYPIFLIISLFLFSILFSNPSYSENLYLFSSIGYSDYQINLKDKTEINNKLTGIGFGSATTSIVTDNVAYKVGFGLRVPLLFIVEGSYVNYGKIKFGLDNRDELNSDVLLNRKTMRLLNVMVNPSRKYVVTTKFSLE